jgi:hypothetical protein
LRLGTLILALCLCLCAGCNVNCPEKTSQSSQKEAAINDLFKKSVREILLNYKLVPFGNGAQAMHEVKMLSLSFKCYRPLSEDKARRMVVKAAEMFRSMINEDESIRPFLYEHPFPINRIGLEIYIYNSDGSKVPTGDLTIAYLEDGKVRFDIRDPTTGRLVTIHKEPYEEAVAKLEAASESIAS